MSRAVLIILFVLACAPAAFPQKYPTAYGDSWVGKVSSINEGTREITLTAPGQGEGKSFVGVLAEGFKANLLDGSVKELKVSEIPLGMRVRVFYETKREAVGGQRPKVNYISRVLFLGRDEFDRLRTRLNLASSTSVTPVKEEGLPGASPLKVYVLADSPELKDSFASWVGEWNKGEAAKYGSIEIVPDFSGADVSLVVYNAERHLTLPGMFAPGDAHLSGASVTAFLVVPKSGGLNILWKYSPLLGTARGRTLREIEGEIKKRMKARSKAQKK